MPAPQADGQGRYKFGVGASKEGAPPTVEGVALVAEPVVEEGGAGR
jgi:hypothetical protein